MFIAEWKLSRRIQRVVFLSSASRLDQPSDGEFHLFGIVWPGVIAGRRAAQLTADVADADIGRREFGHSGSPQKMRPMQGIYGLA